MVSHSDPGNRGRLPCSGLWSGVVGYRVAGRRLCPPLGSAPTSRRVVPHTSVSRRGDPDLPTSVSLPLYFWLCFPGWPFFWARPHSPLCFGKPRPSSPPLTSRCLGGSPQTRPFSTQRCLLFPVFVPEKYSHTCTHTHAHTYGRTRTRITIVLEVVRKGKPCPLPSVVTPPWHTCGRKHSPGEAQVRGGGGSCHMWGLFTSKRIPGAILRVKEGAEA